MYEGTIQEKLDVGDKILLFLSLLVFNQNMFGVFAEKFRHGGQKTAFHVKRWSFQEWTNLSNNAEVLIFFGNSIVKFTEFGDNFMHGCQNCILHVQTNNSRNFLMFGNKVYCFYHFWILIKVFSEFLRKSTARWSKLHSTSTDGPAEKKEQISWITHKFLHSFENWSVKFTEIGENFMHGCKNCILHVRRNNSREICCWEKKFTVWSVLNFNQIMFGVFGEKFRHGGQNCTSRLQMVLPRKKKKSLE